MSNLTHGGVQGVWSINNTSFLCCVLLNCHPCVRQDIVVATHTHLTLCLDIAGESDVGCRSVVFLFLVDCFRIPAARDKRKKQKEHPHLRSNQRCLSEANRWASALKKNKLKKQVFSGKFYRSKKSVLWKIASGKGAEIVCARDILSHTPITDSNEGIYLPMRSAFTAVAISMVVSLLFPQPFSMKQFNYWLYLFFF